MNLPVDFVLKIETNDFSLIMIQWNDRNWSSIQVEGTMKIISLDMFLLSLVKENKGR